MATKTKAALETPRPVFADDEAVSGAELAQVLGLSERRIRQLAESEMFERLGANLYSLRASARAYVDYLRTMNLEAGRGESAELEADRGRLVKARADSAELDLAVKRRELVPIEAVKFEWSDMVLRFRARLLVIPGRLAPLLADVTDPQPCHDLMQGAIYEALDELARSGDEPAEEAA